MWLRTDKFIMLSLFSALKAEPFLASFPAVADQPDLMTMLWKLWQINQKNEPKKKVDFIKLHIKQ